MADRAWPELRYEAWSDTCETLRRWAQIIGKVRLSKTPWINHSWSSALYVTERGLTTSVIHDNGFSFSVELDLVAHQVRIDKSDGNGAAFLIRPEPVASFYDRCRTALRDLGIQASIVEIPNEVPDSTRFREDFIHRSYDAEYAHRFWRILLQCDRLMKVFRSRFVGKCSPVHFFWGSVDIAVTRFSGRRAPEHPGGIPHLPDLVTREAYSHEVSSCGFWPGNELFPRAAFYSYAYPQPPGFERAKTVAGAGYEPKPREFILPLKVVRESKDPDSLLLEFFQTTYDAAADLGHWDRANLEETPYLRQIREERKRAAGLLAA